MSGKPDNGTLGRYISVVRAQGLLAVQLGENVNRAKGGKVETLQNSAIWQTAEASRRERLFPPPPRPNRSRAALDQQPAVLAWPATGPPGGVDSGRNHPFLSLASGAPAVRPSVKRPLTGLARCAPR
jgi:hypothetical protein